MIFPSLFMAHVHASFFLLKETKHKKMSEPEVVKLQAQLHKLQGQLNDVSKDRENLNKGT